MAQARSQSAGFRSGTAENSGIEGGAENDIGDGVIIGADASWRGRLPRQAAAGAIYRMMVIFCVFTAFSDRRRMK